MHHFPQSLMLLAWEQRPIINEVDLCLSAIDTQYASPGILRLSGVDVAIKSFQSLSQSVITDDSGTWALDQVPVRTLSQGNRRGQMGCLLELSGILILEIFEQRKLGKTVQIRHECCLCQVIHRTFLEFLYPQSKFFISHVNMCLSLQSRR